MTYRCFNSFEELADFQRQQDADQLKAREDWIKQNPYLTDPLAETPIEEDPFHRVYDRGEGVDVPLEELIETAKTEVKTRTKNNGVIDPIKNIRIYQDDYENGDYDLRFYGQVLPRMIKQIQKLLPKNSEIKTYDDICKFLDSSEYYVGRSEDEILEKLASLPLKDKSYYKPPTWRLFRRHLKDLDKIFAEKENTPNRQAAQTVAARCVRALTRATKGKDINMEGIRKGFDLAARLGDYLGYDMGPLLSNLTFDITDNPQVAGSYSPAYHQISINPNYTSRTKDMCATIFHEVFHAIDDRLDLDSVMENVIPKDPSLTAEFKEILDDPKNGDGFLMVSAVDPRRLKIPTDLDWWSNQVDPYSATRYLTKRRDGGGDGYVQGSEFITALLSDYIAHPDRIGKAWMSRVLKAFAAQKRHSKKDT